MAEQTVGQEEDARAFEDWWLTLTGFGEYPDKRLARAAWKRALERGLELRGCCEERDE